MKSLRRIGITLAVLALLFGALAGYTIVRPLHRTHAQLGPTGVPGFSVLASNAVVNAAIGNGGAVTNPASNFIILIQGSTVYCGGSNQSFANSVMTLAASTTYQIEWNCAVEQLYAKAAVTGPGTSPTTGLPATILAPIANVEVPLATVVCNATACGNGGNGSITDARPVGAFPGAGLALNTTLFANLPTTNVTDGAIIYCTTCAVATAPCTGASTGALAIRVNTTWRCQ